MKGVRLLRWSGSVLSPRTRPYCLQYQNVLTLRLQSTASAPLQQSIDDIQEPPQTSLSDIDLRQLPSPPPSRALTSAKLSALHARLSLSPRLPIQTLARCLVDPTADRDPSFNNSSLSLLGSDLLGYYTSEAVICRYPRLPMQVTFEAVQAYCGPRSLASITREWGVDVAAEPGGEVDPGLLQCKRIPAANATIGDLKSAHNDPTNSGIVLNTEKGWNRGSARVEDGKYGGEVPRTETDYKERPELEQEDAAARDLKGTTLERASRNFVCAVIGAVYIHGGRSVAKKFFVDHFLSRHLDVSKMFDFKQPTRDLSRLCAREGFDSPVARIISETGRLSRHPVFVVGVFSGHDKLGEGAGASLDEARFRAAVSALKGWYLYSPMEVRVPSEMEGKGGEPWRPVMIDVGEGIM